MDDDWTYDARALVQDLAPGGAPVAMREPFHQDESRWFLSAVDRGIVRFETCPWDCFRARKWGVVGPDHFRTPTGAPRHLFSKPGAPQAWLNREYVPHIAAYARAILDYGYRGETSSFSLYRKFRGDLIAKSAGQSYETDAEFYDRTGGIYLQIEAKGDARQTGRLAREVAAAQELQELPSGSTKELEYVLDLAPAFLWIVGPGAVDPARHVFGVQVNGLNARFTPVENLPGPPM